MAILFGFLLAIFTAALIRGVTGAATTTGRVAAAVFCAALILAVGWASAARRLARVEISKDATGSRRRCRGSRGMTFASSSSMPAR